MRRLPKFFMALRAVCAVCCVAIAPLAQGDTPQLSFYGVPGLIDMPTAFSQPDGQLSFTVSHVGPTLKNTLTFQVTERLSGSFRYSVIDDFGQVSQDALYDRSFDLRYQLITEGAYRPAVTVGLQDFGGTGILAGEYVVASKHVTPRLSVTGGIGWGRLGTNNGFTNPLGLLHDGFETRPSDVKSIERTGRLDADQWFRGDAALFGGVQWQATDQLSVALEYSSDAYEGERARGTFDYKTPFNLGVGYQFDSGWSLGGYLLHGAEAGVLLSYSFNPKTPNVPGGGGGGPVVAPRDSAAAASWGQAWASTPQTAQAGSAAALAALGLEAEALSVTGPVATLHLNNPTYEATPEAIGRAARSLTGTLPPSVEVIDVITVVQGQPVSRVRLQRADLEELEFALDGAWQSYARAQITDAAGQGPAPQDRVPGVYPRLSYRVGGYLAPQLFDPDNPVRADIGVELRADYTPLPGLVFSGRLRQPVIGTLDDATRESNSVIQRVRSDAVLYNTQSDLELSYLTAERFFRPGPSLYGRVTAGYLERMYGGVSAELLWKPVTGPWAFGAEVNYARQRDFDLGFGFQDYDVITGHASAYYDFGNGFLAQVDAGRYLAGDWGATFSLDREFDNGFTVGAFFTLTDVPFDEFGEGSFDKGIRITIPLTWLTGDPSKTGFSQTIRPVTRDGGARLDVRNRLYDLTRYAHDPELKEDWGRFWR